MSLKKKISLTIEKDNNENIDLLIIAKEFNHGSEKVVINKLQINPKTLNNAFLLIQTLLNSKWMLCREIHDNEPKEPQAAPKGD